MGKTRQYHRLYAALAGALALALDGPMALAADKLTVGKADANSTAFLPVHVGDQLGFFKKRGLDLAIADFTGGSKLTQAMTAGSVDIGLGAGTEMALIAKGGPLLAVCNAMSPIPIIGIAVKWDSPIKTVEQLKGKRIGISSPGSLTDWLAKQLAQHEGWGPGDLTPVAIGNGAPAVIAAFRTDAIDADIAVTSNIFNWEENKEGKLLVSATSFVGHISSGTVYATRKLIDTNPDALKRFLAGWIETIDYLTTHEAETIKIESGVTHFSPAVTKKEYDLTAKEFNKDCKFDAESLNNLKRAFVDQKLVDTPPDMSTLYTEAFLPKR